MKLQLIARNLKDDQDHVIEEVEFVDEHSVAMLIQRMKYEIDDNKTEGSNWRYSIAPTEEEYQ